MLLIGITGPTGAGKSIVSASLASRGCFVVDGDAVAREVVVPGSPVLAELALAFGGDVLRADGSLDRGLLAARAFASPEGTARLNAVTHPAINARVLALLDAAERAGFRFAAIDAAALFESGVAGRCDLVVTVTAPLDVRIARVTRRDGLSEREARLRAGAQKNEAYYEQHADIVIRNGESDDLEGQIEKLCEIIAEKVAL